MKLSTKIWAKFESKGKPESTKIINGQLGQVIRDLTQWLWEVRMGHRIVITLGRTEADVSDSTGKASLLNDLDELFSQLESGEGEQPDSDEDE